MVEEEIIVETEIIEYEGPFDLRDLYKIFDSFAIDKGYLRKEKSHTDSMSKEGRSISILLEPAKQLSDYAKSIIQIHINVSGMKDVTVSGKRLQKGGVEIEIKSILQTDYEGKWEGKPVLIFLRALYDKYVYKTVTGGFDKIIIKDTAHLKELVKSFLGLYKF